MLDYEDQYYNDQINYIVGIDEAGRGPLCGPLVAAAVILKKGYKNEHINDSKKLTEKQREEVFLDIIKNALAYSITYIDSNTIDKINIYNATKLAMQQCILKLKHKIDLVLTDAMPINNLNYEIIPIIKGDAKCECIAAASIIAKVCRDRYMVEMSKKYPKYKLEKNKGYGTKEHLEAIKLYGPIRNFHRMTYAPLIQKNIQTKLF